MNSFMKIIYCELARSAKALGLIDLVGISSLLSVHAAPPPSAFGVWGDASFDPKNHPFLKGVACTLVWEQVENKPGLFDWSALDQAMDTAVGRNQFIFLSINVGPDAPEWIYTQGVPRVETRDQIHDSWPAYPFYTSSAYKSFFQRLITEFGKHIHNYPKAKQERIVFIQVKSGCTGDECAYKGNVSDPKYDLPVKSPAWREFRLWLFDLYVKTFQGASDHPQIALLFNNVTADDDEENGKKGGHTEEWKWVMDNEIF